MRLFKLIVTLVILGLIALFIGQNMETWVSVSNFKLNLYLAKTAFSLELYMIIFLSALAGVLIGALALLKPYFKTRRLLANERKQKQAEVMAPAKETPAEPSQA